LPDHARWQHRDNGLDDEFEALPVQRVVSALSLTSLVVLASAGQPAAAVTGAASGASSASAPPAHSAAAQKREAAASAQPVKLVDINSASRKELKTLPGIGDAEAEKIIANRPYMVKADLVGKHVLPLGPFLSLRKQIIALPPQSKATGKSAPASAAKRAG
jgi:DNA uptake protein ComE-like DNA-binding protein